MSAETLPEPTNPHVQRALAEREAQLILRGMGVEVHPTHTSYRDTLAALEAQVFIIETGSAGITAETEDKV